MNETFSQFIWISLLVPAVYTIPLILIPRRIGRKRLDPVPLAVLYLLGTVYLATLPVLSQEGYEPAWLYGLYKTLAIFTLGLDFPENLPVIYSGYLAVLFFIAPLFTFGFIMQFFTEMNAKIMLLIGRGKVFYVFSELNEGSVYLAQSILDEYKKYKINGRRLSENSEEAKHSYFNWRRPQLVFLNVKDSDEDENGFIEAAKLIGALCVKDGIDEFRFGRRRESVNIVLCTDSSETNVSDLLKLNSLKKLERCSDVEIRVFSWHDEYTYIVDSLINDIKIEHEKEAKAEKAGDVSDAEGADESESDSPIPRIMMIYPVRQTIYDLFVKKPLFENVDNGGTISLLVVGNGLAARETVRIASWLGQMETRKLEITLFGSSSEEIRERFDFLYPEMKLNCPITYIDPDRGVSDLQSLLKEKQYSYVVVAWNNEFKPFQNAIQLFTAFKNTNSRDPVICVWNENPDFKDSLNDLKNSGRNSFNFTPLGSLKDVFSFKNIFDPDLDDYGFVVHKFYEGSKETTKAVLDSYYSSEYNRDNSCAAALHTDYKICDLKNLSGSEVTPDNYDALLENYLVNMERSEHKRWSACCRAKGYRKLAPDQICQLSRASKKDVIRKDDEKRCHSCLAEWSEKIADPLKGIDPEDYASRIDDLEQMYQDSEKYDELDRVTLTLWIEYLKYPHKRTRNWKQDYKQLDEAIMRSAIKEVFGLQEQKRS